jgi:hypothetical protein
VPSTCLAALPALERGKNRKRDEKKKNLLSSSSNVFFFSEI